MSALAGYISVPGYPYPIGAKFSPSEIDTSSGEPIVRKAGGYWVWGRGCTQPGGGIMPAWGFVRTTTGAGSFSQPARTGVGATSSSSGVVPSVLIGGAILVGLAAVVALATRDRNKALDDEAVDVFPPPHGRNTRAPRGRKAQAYQAAAGRCFYKELRAEHTPTDAARIARQAVRKEHSWLVGLSRTGASVDAGCGLLRRHAATIFVH